MRFRAALASLLAVILLSLSTFASACEIRCDLIGISIPCHGGALATEGHRAERNAPVMDRMSIPGMPMAGMQQAPLSQNHRSHSGSMLLEKPALCLHQGCTEQPVLVSGKNAWTEQMSFSQRTAVVAGLVFLHPGSSTSVDPQQRPHLLPASPVSRHTTLRI